MICILTQPLGPNYGGVLQAYALQMFLKHQNFNCIVANICNSPYSENIFRRYRRAIKRFFLKYVFGKKELPVTPYQLKMKRINEFQTLYKNNLDFIKKHINMSDRIEFVKEICILQKYNIDTYVVGSDQVWRPKYSPYQPHFFLDFAKDKTDVKRIAYAASFGVDDNEFSDKLLDICKPLAKKFDAVSVREDSGIGLCKELFGVNAVQVLDPTLLFDAEHYTKLSYERDDFSNDGNLFTYVLDESNEKQEIIDAVIRAKFLKPFRVLPKSKYENGGIARIEDCILPPVEQWLRGFVDAKYVVTDSFHGTVFSILFKRPFIAIVNASRGMTRFTSLLKLLGLEDRLVFKPEDVTTELINKPIDYEKVFTILETERKKSTKFLIDALNIAK